jgi:competence ComEA-like helix-hairpin-helix protein
LQELQNRVKKAKPAQGLVDLNTATGKELQSIKGIGPVLAERIIAGRPYRTVDDLLKVKGIGPKRLENIRPYFTVGKEERKSH